MTEQSNAGNDNVFIHRIMYGTGIVCGLLGAGASSAEFMTMFGLSFLLGLIFIFSAMVMLPSGEQLYYDEKQSSIIKAAVIAGIFNLATFFIAYGIKVVITAL